jgi:hypothetical protein
MAVALAAAATAATGAPASAQPAGADDPIELRWTAPSACPDAARVRAEMDRLLGGKPSVASGKRLRASAEVFASEAGGWRLKLRTESGGAAGERSLRDDSCDALADTAALILAMAFDPEAVAAQAERARAAGAATGAPAATSGAAPTTAPPPAPATAPPPRAEPAPAVATPERDAMDDDPPPVAGGGGFVGARVGGDIGSVLVPALGLTVAGGLVWQRLRLELEATWWLSRDVALEDAPRKGGTFTFVSGALAGCGVVLRAPVELGGCGALEIGRIQAEGYGVASRGEASTVLVAGRATVNAAWSLTDAVWLRADAGVAVPVERTAWVLRNAGKVGTSPAAAGRIAVGPEIRF